MKLIIMITLVFTMSTLWAQETTTDSCTDVTNSTCKAPNKSSGDVCLDPNGKPIVKNPDGSIDN